MLVLSVPAVAYALYVRLRHHRRGADIRERLGIVRPSAQSVLVALAICVPLCILTGFVAHWTKDFEGSMLAEFDGAAVGLPTVSSALLYGFVATGFPEELIFRGLIAGALFRRLSVVGASVIQSTIFVLPHLLILFVDPSLWPLAVALPFVLGLVTGELRRRSGSIFPGVLVHGLPNAAGALSVLAWS